MPKTCQWVVNGNRGRADHPKVNLVEGGGLDLDPVVLTVCPEGQEGHPLSVLVDLTSNFWVT